MKTTIDMDDALVREAMRLYGAKTKKQIVAMGLEELVRADKRARLVEAFGSQPGLKETRRRR